MRALLTLLLAVSELCAQRVPFINTPPTTRAGQPLASVRRELQRDRGRRWVAWTVASAVPQQGCCWSNSQRGCGREGQQMSAGASAQRPVKLEGERFLGVPLRLENGSVRKVHTYSGECELDPDGVLAVELTGVDPRQSLQLLATLVSRGDFVTARQQTALVVHAIARHAIAEADSLLTRLAQPEYPESVRQRVAFWAGPARGAAGLQLLDQMAQSDPTATVFARM